MMKLGLLRSELLVLEIDYRRKRGESPELADYADRFPDHLNTIRDALGVGLSNDGRRFRPPELTEIGQLFPALEIKSLLGAGGMGAVYQAKQKGLDRNVALKILPAELGPRFEICVEIHSGSASIGQAQPPKHRCHLRVWECGRRVLHTHGICRRSDDTGSCPIRRIGA